jgi:hypothetical protein
MATRERRTSSRKMESKNANFRAKFNLPQAGARRR